MKETTVNEQVPTTVPVPESVVDTQLVISELLVEDVSIDGMCGVY